ncbi:MAG: Filamentation induced by cAMP protein Fic, partial [Candidatus Moranbacteria bacterium GW2011_GWD2_38_7]
MTFDRNVPYNDLPLLPPGVDFETKEILKKIVLAREALAKLDASNKRLPNESLLINSVILQEARMSSEIENIVTTNDEMYKAIVTENKDIDPELKEVIHYPGALWHGHEFIKKNGFMNTNLFVEMVNIIKEHDAGIRKIPGTKLSNPKTGEIYYTPPEGEDIVRKKLKNLEDYMNDTSDNIDPLIKMAVIHYQFEAIHPFHDGNGRTGRIINILFLVMNGLLEQPILYLSKYIIENKGAYYTSLRNITEKNDWMPWVEYMIEAIESTARYTEQKVNDICDLMKKTGDDIKSNLPGIYSREL